MNRWLERLDGAASTVVPLLYLAGLALGTLAYFTGVTADFGVAVGVALGIAVEVHSFLQLRRTRAAYGLFSRLSEDDQRRDVALRQLRINVLILAALVSFSAYNATSFAASTWRPTGGFLPIPVQIAIRGLIVPAFFLLAGFLSPLTQDAGALLADASHTMLHKTLKTTLKQWKKRVDRAARSGLDLAPVAVALMRDAGDDDGARRVALIADGLNAAEGVGPFPTGPGTPLPAPSFHSDLNADESRPDWNLSPDVFRLPASRRATAGAVASEQVERGAISADDVRRTAAYGLLDTHPNISRKALMAALRAAGLGCRDDTLREMMTRWAQQRGSVPRPLPARMIESDGADEPEHDAGQQLAQ